MGSSVNIGRMRDIVKLYYLTGSEKDDAGSYQPTYTEVNVWADVKPMPFEMVQRYGLNFEEQNYMVTCRNYQTGRIAYIDYNGVKYDALNPIPDKYGQFVKIYMKRKA